MNLNLHINLSSLPSKSKSSLIVSKYNDIKIIGGTEVEHDGGRGIKCGEHRSLKELFSLLFVSQ